MFDEKYRDIPIERLALSARTFHMLKRAGIDTIGKIHDSSLNFLFHLKGIGSLSAAELERVKNAIENSELDLTENGIVIPNNSENTTPQSLAIDVFKSYHLSNRAINKLVSLSIVTPDKIVTLAPEYIFKLPGIGGKTALEIIAFLRKYKDEYKMPLGEKNIISEMISFSPDDKQVFQAAGIQIDVEKTEVSEDTFVQCIYQKPDVQKAIKNKILKIVGNYPDGISLSDLLDRMPKHLSNTVITEQFVFDLEGINQIEEKEGKLVRIFPRFSSYIEKNLTGREKEIVLKRISGLTLETIANDYGLTRERVRQIYNNVVRNKPRVREDDYLYAFEHYQISKENFQFAFPNESDETFYYLSFSAVSKFEDRKPLEAALEDENIPTRIRRQLEKATNKNYLIIDGNRIPKSRGEIIRYLVQTLCVEDTKADDFAEFYNQFLADNGLENVENLSLNSAQYIINRLAASKFVLWKQGRTFRYYNIDGRDYSDLVSALNLRNYRGLEISTLKLFRDYSEVMDDYDIHDEYELHDLLKKIWNEYSDGTEVEFARMPTLVIGKAERTMQLKQFMFDRAPISLQDYCQQYEEAYGFRAATVLGSFVPVLYPYLQDGRLVYTESHLTHEQYEFLRATLTDDVYSFNQIKSIFHQKYPDENPDKVTSYSLNLLGFHIYSTYLINGRYQNTSDYLHHILLEPDIVDISAINPVFSSTSTFTNYLYACKYKLDLIEFEPKQYLNFRRLASKGYSKADLREITDSLALSKDRGAYFTIKSLRNEGFTSQFDDLGMDDCFYESIILADRINFSSTKFGLQRLFCRGKEAVFTDFLYGLVEELESIDIFDLEELLADKYGFKIKHDKLMETIKETNLYYDKIMEKVYIDYDTYFAEV